MIFPTTIVLEVARLSRVTVSWGAGRVHANPISTPWLDSCFLGTRDATCCAPTHILAKYLMRTMDWRKKCCWLSYSMNRSVKCLYCLVINNHLLDIESCMPGNNSKEQLCSNSCINKALCSSIILSFYRLVGSDLVSHRIGLYCFILLFFCGFPALKLL